MLFYVGISLNVTITASKCFVLTKHLPLREYKSSVIQLAYHEQNGEVDICGLYTFVSEVRELLYKQRLDTTG